MGLLQDPVNPETLQSSSAGGDGHAAQPSQHASGEASGAEAGADHEQQEDAYGDAELEEAVVRSRGGDLET